MCACHVPRSGQSGSRRSAVATAGGGGGRRRRRAAVVGGGGGRRRRRCGLVLASLTKVDRSLSGTQTEYPSSGDSTLGLIDWASNAYSNSISCAFGAAPPGPPYQNQPPLGGRRRLPQRPGPAPPQKAEWRGSGGLPIYMGWINEGTHIGKMGNSGNPPFYPRSNFKVKGVGMQSHRIVLLCSCRNSHTPAHADCSPNVLVHHGGPDDRSKGGEGGARRVAPPPPSPFPRPSIPCNGFRKADPAAARRWTRRRQPSHTPRPPLRNCSLPARAERAAGAGLRHPRYWVFGNILPGQRFSKRS
eukprot:gene16296-biopygen14321